ncbi:hypothetical protein ACVBE9_12205 [Eionea flava]
MEFIELMDKHRDYYVNDLVEVFAKTDGAKEILVDSKSNEELEVYRLTRFDILQKNEEGEFRVLEFNNDAYLNHQTVSFEIQNSIVLVSPVYWNGVEIEAKGFDGNMSNIFKWIEKWLDIKDEFFTEQNISGRIHSFMRPETKNNAHQFAIDFGTSSSEAISEFVNILIQQGAKSIAIDSKSMLSNEK